MLLDETGLAGAIEVTERIRRAIAESFVTHHDREIRCTMSFGLTQLIPGDTLGEAIARADHALYRAGRGEEIALTPINFIPLRRWLVASTVGCQSGQFGLERRHLQGRCLFTFETRRYGGC